MYVYILGTFLVLAKIPGLLYLANVDSLSTVVCVLYVCVLCVCCMSVYCACVVCPCIVRVCVCVTCLVYIVCIVCGLCRMQAVSKRMYKDMRKCNECDTGTHCTLTLI